jgi:hypothetical protein
MNKSTMKLKYLLTLVIVPLLATVLPGCSKNLDIEPISSITKDQFFKTENDVQGALNGMYVALRGQTDLNLIIWGEARSEILTGSIAGSLGYEKYYNNTMTVDNAGPDWGGMYTTINDASLILKYTPDIFFSVEANKNNALAQAYTMRAFCYFTLVRTFGGVPIRNEPTEAYSPGTIQLPRATEAEVFQLIKSDLDKAISLFPNNSLASGRNKWSKAAANALKADVYLWTGKRLNGGTADFTTALNAINDLQTASGLNLLPNFADIFRYSNKGNNEILMAIRFQISESSNQTFAHNMYASTSSYPAYIPQSQRDSVGTPLAGNGSVWRISPLVRNQFSDQDTRKKGTYIDVQGTGANQYYTTYTWKYNGTVENGTRYFMNDFILYRLGDVLLLKAEAKNALGQDPTPEMTAIRQRAWGANYAGHEFVNGTKAQNDDAILKERLFELTNEGKRWWDLVRFGKAFDIVPSLQGKQSQTHLLYFPIGVSTRTRETLVEETPGWQ